MEEKKDVVQEKKLSVIESANSAAERLEKANAEMKENIAKIEEIKASDQLSGTTEQPQPEKPKEETPTEYKNRVMSGNL
jgi:hypothetical protein